MAGIRSRYRVGSLISLGLHLLTITDIFQIISAGKYEWCAGLPEVTAIAISCIWERYRKL